MLTPVFFGDLENIFGFLNLAQVGVVNFAGIQFLELLFFYKSTLVSKSLLGEVLSAAIAYSTLLMLSTVLLFPKPLNFGPSLAHLLRTST